MLRRTITAEPAESPEIHALYEAAVAPLEIVTIIVSFAEMYELFNVNDTLVVAANAALFIVI